MILIKLKKQFFIFIYSTRTDFSEETKKRIKNKFPLIINLIKSFGRFENQDFNKNYLGNKSHPTRRGCVGGDEKTPTLARRGRGTFRGTESQRSRISRLPITVHIGNLSSCPLSIPESHPARAASPVSFRETLGSIVSTDGAGY